MPEFDLAALAQETVESFYDNVRRYRPLVSSEFTAKVLAALQRVQAETREADAQIAEIYTQLSQDPDSMPEAERTESLMLRTQRVVAKMIAAALRAQP